MIQVIHLGKVGVFHVSSREAGARQHRVLKDRALRGAEPEQKNTSRVSRGVSSSSHTNHHITHHTTPTHVKKHKHDTRACMQCVHRLGKGTDAWSSKQASQAQHSNNCGQTHQAERRRYLTSLKGEKGATENNRHRRNSRSPKRPPSQPHPTPPPRHNTAPATPVDCSKTIICFP